MAKNDGIYIGQIDERGGDDSKMSHILFKEIERLYRVEKNFKSLLKELELKDEEITQLRRKVNELEHKF